MRSYPKNANPAPYSIPPRISSSAGPSAKEEIRGGMELGARFAFFGWERIARFAWIRQTRGLEAETRSDPRGLLLRADLTSRNMKSTSRGL